MKEITVIIAHTLHVFSETKITSRLEDCLGCFGFTDILLWSLGENVYLDVSSEYGVDYVIAALMSVDFLAKEVVE